MALLIHSFSQVEKHIPQKEVSVSGNTCFRKKKKKVWYEEALFLGKYILFFISNLNIYVVLQNTWYGKINEKIFTFTHIHTKRERGREKFQSIEFNPELWKQTDFDKRAISLCCLC